MLHDRPPRHFHRASPQETHEVRSLSPSSPTSLIMSPFPFFFSFFNGSVQTSSPNPAFTVSFHNLLHLILRPSLKQVPRPSKTAPPLQPPSHTNYPIQDLSYPPQVLHKIDLHHLIHLAWSSTKSRLIKKSTLLHYDLTDPH